MTDEQKEILAAIVIVGSFIIPEVDAIYITSKMKESGHYMEIQCHDEPNKCWLQKRAHK